MMTAQGQRLARQVGAIWPELGAEQRQAVIRYLAQLALKQLGLQTPSSPQGGPHGPAR